MLCEYGLCSLPTHKWLPGREKTKNEKTRRNIKWMSRTWCKLEWLRITTDINVKVGEIQHKPLRDITFIYFLLPFISSIPSSHSFPSPFEAWINMVLYILHGSHEHARVRPRTLLKAIAHITHEQREVQMHHAIHYHGPDESINCTSTHARKNNNILYGSLLLIIRCIKNLIFYKIKWETVNLIKWKASLA
jgi:hypothetical protein